MFDIRTAVFAALDNAKENGYYNPATFDPASEAIDLVTYDADLEDAPIEDVERYAAEWHATKSRG